MVPLVQQHDTLVESTKTINILMGVVDFFSIFDRAQSGKAVC